MRLEEHYVPPASNLMNDYINGQGTIGRYFTYEPKVENLQKRYEQLATHEVDRSALSSVIHNYMKPFGISAASKAHLKDLEAGAPVIVTGQQAGLLSGPLYTVHKAISVIVLAKQASEMLGRKVVPVFWVAGEDHDLAEISHLYREVNGRIDKLNFPHAEYGKNSASSAQLNKTRIQSYLEDYFRSLPETAHSKELHQLTFGFLEESDSFTDFFSSFLNHFFNEEGLLFIDAASDEFRKLESPFFVRMIEQAEEIAASVRETEQQLINEGYAGTIEAQEDAAHLFITVKGERVLLQRDNGRFVGNEGAVSFSKEELLEIARHQPELLSNNVVTRPIMQELVFPVLAFVGGPGEIAYWAAFKGAFAALNLEMPIVMPRLGMTLVNRQVQHLMNKYDLTFLEIVNDGKVEELRHHLLESIREKEAEALIENLQSAIENEYEKITDRFSSISKGLTPIVEKNKDYHLKQLTYLRNKLEDEVLLQNSVQMDHFDSIENELVPADSLQERIYNPFPYLNEYGPELIKELTALPFKYDKNHKTIYL